MNNVLARIITGGLGMVLGATAGAGSGFVLGWLLGPTRDPGQPLIHEWYIMAVFAYVLEAAIAGAVMGAIVGAAPFWEIAIAAAAGLLAGICVGAAIWASGPSPPHQSYAGATIIYGGWVGSLLGASTGGVVRMLRRRS